jgi:hypothetical protein
MDDDQSGRVDENESKGVRAGVLAHDVRFSSFWMNYEQTRQLDGQSYTMPTSPPTIYGIDGHRRRSVRGLFNR